MRGSRSRAALASVKQRTKSNQVCLLGYPLAYEYVLSIGIGYIYFLCVCEFVDINNNDITYTIIITMMA